MFCFIHKVFALNNTHRKMHSSVLFLLPLLSSISESIFSVSFRTGIPWGEKATLVVCTSCSLFIPLWLFVVVIAALCSACLFVCSTNKISKFYRWHKVKLAELFDGINGIYRSICHMENRLRKLMEMSYRKRWRTKILCMPKYERNQSLKWAHSHWN